MARALLFYPPQLCLEEAVRKMTSLPARKLRLKNKGMIAERYDADIVVFDPATVIDTSTYEAPRNFPVGIDSGLRNHEKVATG